MAFDDFSLTKDVLLRRVGMTSVSVTARFGLRRMRRDCAHVSAGQVTAEQNVVPGGGT